MLPSAYMSSPQLDRERRRQEPPSRLCTRHGAWLTALPGVDVMKSVRGAQGGTPPSFTPPRWPPRMSLSGLSYLPALCLEPPPFSAVCMAGSVHGPLFEAVQRPPRPRHSASSAVLVHSAIWRGHLFTHCVLCVPPSSPPPSRICSQGRGLRRLLSAANLGIRGGARCGTRAPRVVE